MNRKLTITVEEVATGWHASAHVTQKDGVTEVTGNYFDTRGKAINFADEALRRVGLRWLVEQLTKRGVPSE